MTQVVANTPHSKKRNESNMLYRRWRSFRCQRRSFTVGQIYLHVSSNSGSRYLSLFYNLFALKLLVHFKVGGNHLRK